MPINILHVVQSLNVGGLENGVVNLINNMCPNDFLVHVYCVNEIGTLSKRIIPNRTRVVLRRGPKNLGSIARDISRVCRENCIDVVHTHGWGTLFVGVVGSIIGRARGVINGEHGLLYDDTCKRRLVQKLLFRFVDVNITVSQSLKDDIVKRFNVSAKMFVPILNGVNTEIFRVSSEERKIIRNELNIGETAFVVGTVGRLDPVKSYDTLVRSFSSFRARLGNSREVKLVIGGDGPERSRLENLSLDLGLCEDILMLGQRTDVPALMNAFDVFVLPSKSEGMSNTLLEAMACGKPIVATAVAGNLEVVVDEHNGKLFGFGDVDALTETLVDLSLNKKKLIAYGRRGLELVENRFALRRMVSAYEGLYRRVYESTC